MPIQLSLDLIPSRDDAFIGGKDACVGDSGGPLWKWIGRAKKVAFQVSSLFAFLFLLRQSSTLNEGQTVNEKHLSSL